MIGTGTGSELRQPLGFAMVGGLLLSQLLTLFTTPVVSIYMDRRADGLQTCGAYFGAGDHCSDLDCQRNERVKMLFFTRAGPARGNIG